MKLPQTQMSTTIWVILLTDKQAYKQTNKSENITSFFDRDNNFEVEMFT